jgi:hypothetical protein
MRACFSSAERLITKEVPYAVERIVEKFIEVPGRYCRKFFLFGDCVQSIRALIFSMHCTVERVVTKEVPVPYEVKANPEIIQVVFIMFDVCACVYMYTCDGVLKCVCLCLCGYAHISVFMYSSQVSMYP